MTFKEIREGYQLQFLINKDTGLSYQTSNVVHVSEPYFPTNLQSSIGQSNLTRYVDITATLDGKTTTYALKEDSSVMEAPGGITIAVDKSSLLREVEAIKTHSQEILSQVDKHNQNVVDCDKILEQLNPDLAQKKAQDRRINTLEERVTGMDSKLEEILRAIRSVNK